MFIFATAYLQYPRQSYIKNVKIQEDKVEEFRLESLKINFLHYHCFYHNFPLLPTTGCADVYDVYSVTYWFSIAIVIPLRPCTHE